MKLIDVCDFQGGSQPPKEEWAFEEQDGYIRMLQIRDFTQSEKVIPEYIKVSNSTKTCEVDDILIARYGASIGKILTGLAGAYNVAIMRTVPDTSKVQKRYLYYYLKSPYFQNAILNVGSRAAQAGFNKEDLSKLEIKCPALIDQGEIVSVLEKVESVIQKRKQELQLLDNLIKARFVELFGNPFDGTAKYPIHQVGEVANSIDPQPSHRTPPVEEGGIPYVSIKDCDYKTGKIDFEGARKVSPKVLEEHMNRYTLHDGDFVVGKIGTIGNPVFVPARNDYTLSANVVLVQPNSELVNPYFLKYSFESDFVERQFAEAKNSTSQAAFGIQKVRTVEVMNPDLDVQREFEIFVKQVNKSKVKVQKALDETQKLFDSLMQQYFG
ncbi:restriction endonuclease subunit S [Blautia obeum]|uniref:Type I restriction modification DNA specificity domain-containing protein n=1 Tax=Blautia obeum TaxID=40520 RepID=A0A367FWV7_9FIRM|nr:restriction endonuclease subunit S [Blautia obeum]RCH42443.1 hypothetical protein C4886_14275 [Blautia obeum]